MRRFLVLGVLGVVIASLAVLVACGASSVPAATISGSITRSLLPVPPFTATVLGSIQNATDDWSDCSGCSGGSLTSSYSTNPFVATPSLSGSSRQFFIGGPAWGSALWIHKLEDQDSASHFWLDFYIYFDSASAATVWSAEYDLWQSIGGQKFMMGSQCVFGTNEWDVWDSGNNKWVNTGVPCPRFSGDAWHHIQWDIERISPTQYRFNTLFVDDRPFPINLVFGTEPTDWSDDIGIQWQLDQNGDGDPVREWVDKVTLTLW